MTHLTPPAPAERFARLIEALCRAVAAGGMARGLAGPLTILIWSRLRHLAAGFAALAARIAAGRVRRIPVRRRPRATARRAAPRLLPQSDAWLVQLLPETAASSAQLRHLLAAPEMAALIAAAPQMRRLLRPLGRMLGVRLPAAPATPAAQAAAPPPPAAPHAIAPRGIAPPRPGRPAPRRASSALRPHPPPVPA